jgi:hypothetical protein
MCFFLPTLLSPLATDVLGLPYVIVSEGFLPGFTEATSTPTAVVYCCQHCVAAYFRHDKSTLTVVQS